MSSKYIIKGGGCIADHRKTPILFALASSYLPLYFGASLVPWRPLLMRFIISPGSPFLYSAAQSSVLFIVQNAFDRAISCISALQSFCSMYCSTFTISSVVDIPSLYPYWLFLVSMCVILLSCLAIITDPFCIWFAWVIWAYSFRSILGILCSCICILLFRWSSFLVLRVLLRLYSRFVLSARLPIFLPLRMLLLVFHQFHVLSLCDVP